MRPPPPMSDLRMGLVLDSFWRAAMYCLMPRVMLLSLSPLIVMLALSMGLGYLYWEPAIDALNLWLSESELLDAGLSWLEEVFSLHWLRAVLAPLVMLCLATPVIVVLSLLLVGLVMTPATVMLVADRRFPKLEKKHGASWLASLGWSVLSTVVAVVALVASSPLWFIPPLILVVPPLIWGWLTYRVFSFDALADHASAEERRLLMVRHRSSFLLLGVISGYLGTLPSVMWASGAMFIAMAPLLIPLAIWLYTLIFAFSSLWFTHFALAALVNLREQDAEPRPGFAAARDAVLNANGVAGTPVDIGTPGNELVPSAVSGVPSEPASVAATDTGLMIPPDPDRHR